MTSPWDAREECRTLVDLARALHSTFDMAEVRRRAVDAVTILLRCEGGCLALLDPSGKEVFIDYAAGGKGDALRDTVRLQRGEGIVGRVIDEGCTVKIDELSSADGHASWVDEQLEFTTRNLAAVPVREGGKVVGALEAVNHRDAPFDDEDLRRLEGLAELVAVALGNAKLVEALRESNDRIRKQQEALVQSEKMSAMGQLSAGVAHEIRSPLAAISGYAQLLKKKVADPEVCDRLSIIERSVNHINRIVNGLLDFARRKEKKYEPGQLQSVVEEALVIAEPSLKRHRNVKVERDFHEGLADVELDRRQLQQVCINLILNAAQAMRKGGTLTISTFSVPPEEAGAKDKVALTFRDTGPGIEAEKQDLIFQPFYTEGKRDGTGLGLAICRSIIKDHRGLVDVRSVPGEGACFRVLLPALPGDPSQAGKGTEA